MFRTLTTIGVLLLVGKSFLIDKGVPVDGIVEHGSQAISAPFDWDRYDAASAALIAFLGWNVWRKRPKWARFISKRKARKTDAADQARYASMQDPLTVYGDKIRDQLWQFRNECVEAMRSGRSQLVIHHEPGQHVPSKIIEQFSTMMGGEFPGCLVRQETGRTIVDWSNCRTAQEELRDRKTASMQAQYASVPPNPQPPF